MSPTVKKLLGQAVIRTMAGHKREAAELSSKAQSIYDREVHLYAKIEEIIASKVGEYPCRKTIML
jgi:hypothetical protein